MQDQPAWPKVTFESLTWVPSESAGLSRRTQLIHRGKFEAAIPAKIADLYPALSAETQALADEAAIELARFDSQAGSFLLPFAALLLRSEAASSSQIENLSATPGAVLKAEIGLSTTTNARLILSNQNALSSAIGSQEDISLAELLSIHRLLLAESSPEIAGKLRDQQGWIGGSGAGPQTAVYVAPQASRVGELISDWFDFSNRVDMPAIIQVAVAHAQFETIHPFADGNGRTGRALIHSMLKRLGVVETVAIPISAGLLRNTEQYFGALVSYRQGELNPIVQVLARAILEAVAFGQNLIDDIESVHSQWQESVLVRSDSSLLRLLDHLVKQPVITSNEVIRALNVTPRSAFLAIEKLVEIGILEQLGTGARNRVWQASELLHVLEKHSSKLTRES